MAEKVAMEEMVETMYSLVKEYAGKKKMKPKELMNELFMKYGEDRVSKDEAKEALKELVDSGKCVYTYLGTSYIELPSNG
ncbi:hypothetical protein ACFLXC_02655 [Chloroflexota bacterium]